MSQKPWKELVLDVVTALPREFRLGDVLKHEAHFRRHYPNNRFIDAKIRQTLQVLRDQGAIRFLDRGRYQRLDLVPAFSVMFDPALAEGYSSRSEIARVLIETWAEMNLYCLGCSCDSLLRLPTNTPVADFACNGCGRNYQLKAKDGRFKDKLVSAAYGPLIRAARTDAMPEHVLVEFDTRFSMVGVVRAIPGRRITADRIVPRKPLSPAARRSGWIGCTVNILGLPYVSVVSPHPDERIQVRQAWSKLTR